MSSGSGQTAQTLILIGLILQVVQVAIVVGLGLFLVVLPLAAAILFGLAFIGMLWLLLVYLFSYGPTRERDYEAARTPTLVFGILSLLTANILPGILYIVAFVSLGDADGGRVALYPPPNPFPYGPPPPALAAPARYCPRCGRLGRPGDVFCESCGSAFA